MSAQIIETLNVPYYRFLYKDLKRIGNYESHGNTRVRFVSKALRHRGDDTFRHVYLECKHGNVENVFENSWIEVSKNGWRDEFSITLPNVPFTMDEMLEMQSTLPNYYIIGIHDCRHHVSEMLTLCYPLKD